MNMTDAAPSPYRVDATAVNRHVNDLNARILAQEAANQALQEEIQRLQMALYQSGHTPMVGDSRTLRTIAVFGAVLVSGIALLPAMAQGFHIVLALMACHGVAYGLLVGVGVEVVGALVVAARAPDPPIAWHVMVGLLAVNCGTVAWVLFAAYAIP